jgi:hypothetical protein
MIRTLIEVQGDDEWAHGRELKAALWRAGFVPRSELRALNEQLEELCLAVKAKGIDPWAAVDEYREARSTERSPTAEVA